MSLIGALTKAAKAGETVKKTAPFYSAVDEALANLKRPKGTGIEFLTEVLKQPGVKKAEIADRKLEQAFKAKGKMTKEEAQQVLADNPPPKLKEKVYDESTAIDENELREIVSQEMYGKPYSQIRFGSPQHRKISDEVYTRMDMDNGTTYGQYKTPNGENYREILLKLPSERPYAGNYSDPAKYDADLRAYNASGKKDYLTQHWKDDTNVLAHMRVQDRKGANGEKILHVEEIQSDWHQEGRKKGYADPANRFEVFDPKDGTPIAKFATIDEAKAFADKAGPQFDYGKSEGVTDAPFKKNWHELAMKRLLNYAADNGYDSIAITPGAEQAKRFDLSKQVESVAVSPTGDGMYRLDATLKNGGTRAYTNLNASGVEDMVGKEISSKLLSAAEERSKITKEMRDALKVDNDAEYDRLRDVRQNMAPAQLSGLDLQFGGEGMKGFYDKILPDYLNTFGKPYGAQVQQVQIPIKHELQGLRNMGGYPEEPPLTLHNFPITPEMRESIKQKGLPLYQQIGIPTAGAGAASQTIQPEEEIGLSGGGIINSAIKQAHLAKLAKMRQEMTPRAEAVKALISKDENSYLRDVVPNSLTNESIESEIARMKARAEAAQPEVKEAKGGVVRMTKNRDAMFMELSNKKLKRK
jgi:hypothetical protein